VATRYGATTTTAYCEHRPKVAHRAAACVFLLTTKTCTYHLYYNSSATVRIASLSSHKSPRQITWLFLMGWNQGREHRQTGETRGFYETWDTCMNCIHEIKLRAGNRIRKLKRFPRKYYQKSSNRVTMQNIRISSDSFKDRVL
jgi:ribulose bisphosphate carboxylase small subunit